MAKAIAASKGDVVAVDGAEYHVTAVRDGGVYGHSVAYCSESGCSGNERYLGLTPDETWNRYDQAVDGLQITTRNGVVLVDDGDSHWVCSEAEWNAAQARMAAEKPISGDEDDAGPRAYGDLCDRLKTHAGIHGCGGNWRPLVESAIASGLADADAGWVRQVLDAATAERAEAK